MNNLNITRKIKLPTIKPEQVAKEIGDFIVDTVIKVSATGVVVGLSGGVDSTLSAVLAKKGFDEYNFQNPKTKLEVVGYILPSNTNHILDSEDGKKVAEKLGIRYEVFNIESIVEAYRTTNPEALDSSYNKGNMMSRIRANILSTKAASEKKIVLGTGNKDEDFGVGYYTLFGDGAVHLSPIGNLSKRLVRQMASYFGFDETAKRIPTAGLEPGQTDFKDLGYSYETVELVVSGFEQGLDLEDILSDELFVLASTKDLDEYTKIYGKSKFQNSNEIILDIIKRNKIAKLKAKIIHPPIAQVTLNYNLDEKMKVALFGGSFNPIHNGHLQIANQLIEKKIVDQVWFVPCGNHPFDKKLASGEVRMKMINLVIGNNPSIKAVGVELDPDKKSYTSKTISWFKREFPHDFYFVLGADNLKDLEKWYAFEYLRKNVEFILIKRPGFEFFNNIGINVKYILDIDNKISSNQIRENLEKGISIKCLVPEKVEECIKQGGLYHG
ncbi:MAG: NAD(+) synthase [Nanoarchaeota archaeon]